ncbi:helix-turn-helix domain-containing protein [Listeria ilorinensis]|uniref:helix-turn-helix domain-containing protein n=1 Tax=Listeria ilorinensis TaxID=2867439 RepID=UPI00336C1D97
MLENEIGSVLRELREESGLTRKELYGGIMSSAHYYRVEMDNQVPSFFKITEILKRLSLGLDEFMFIANDFQFDETETFIQRFLAVKTTLNVEALYQLKEELDQVIEKVEKPFLICLSQVLDGYLYIQKTSDWAGARKKFNQVWNILEKKDSWHYQDILLMSNIFYIFEEPAISLVYNRLNYYYEKYGNFKDLSKMKRITKYNYCSHLRLNGRQLENEQRLNELVQEAKKAQDISMFLESKYYLSELLWMKNKKKEGRKEAEKVIGLLEQLELNDFAMDNRKDWKNLTGEDLQPHPVV